MSIGRPTRIAIGLYFWPEIQLLGILCSVFFASLRTSSYAVLQANIFSATNEIATQGEVEWILLEIHEHTAIENNFWPKIQFQKNLYALYFLPRFSATN